MDSSRSSTSRTATWSTSSSWSSWRPGRGTGTGTWRLRMRPVLLFMTSKISCDKNFKSLFRVCQSSLQSVKSKVRLFFSGLKSNFLYLSVTDNPKSKLDILRTVDFDLICLFWFGFDWQSKVKVGLSNIRVSINNVRKYKLQKSSSPWTEDQLNCHLIWECTMMKEVNKDAFNCVNAN